MDEWNLSFLGAPFTLCVDMIWKNGKAQGLIMITSLLVLLNPLLCGSLSGASGGVSARQAESRLRQRAAQCGVGLRQHTQQELYLTLALSLPGVCF